MEQVTYLEVTPERTAIEQTVAETIIADPEGETDGIDQRVLNGVRKLDREVPGWADQINLGRFRITSGSACVLGQVYGEYETGVRRLFHVPHDDGQRFGYEYGFVGENTESEFATDWKVLQRDWKKVIAERQTSPPDMSGE